MFKKFSGRAFYVYELVDPRGPTVFYIGKTKDPAVRLGQHSSNPESSAFARIQELKNLGLDVSMKIIGRFSSEAECTAYESHLIHITKNTLNRTGRFANVEPDPAKIVSPHIKCLDAVNKSVGHFSGVLQARDAAKIWKRLRKSERDALAGIVKYEGCVRRAKAFYPIRWYYRLPKGAEIECSTEIVESLVRRGLLNSGRDKATAIFKVTPIGKFVAENGVLGARVWDELSRVA